MQQNDESRRSFLKTVLAGSATVATVAVTGKKASAASKKNKQTDEVLYKETQAFTEYYDSLR